MTERSKEEKCELKITPAMLEAGVRAFCEYDERFEQPKDVVPDIFWDMVSASPDLTKLLGERYLLATRVQSDQMGHEYSNDGYKEFARRMAFDITNTG